MQYRDSTDVVMDGQLDGWMDGWMVRWLPQWLNEWLGSWQKNVLPVIEVLLNRRVLIIQTMR